MHETLLITALAAGALVFLSRARSNEHLIGAFNISNCFTASNPRVCNDFRTAAIKLIKIDGTGWLDLSVAIRGIIDREAKRHLIKVSVMVQLTSMKAVLGPLLNFDVDSTNADDDVRQLAYEINCQWLRAKAQPEAPWGFDHQHALQAALGKVFPGYDSTNSTSNPLNLILPGYETLWRVVLRCLLEINFRGHHNSHHWKRALHRFLPNPTTYQLDCISDETGNVSAAMVIYEALRLWPPTRRIKRAFAHSTGQEVQGAANIEKCHRIGDIWGSEPLEYRPERWTSDRGDEKFMAAHFLPFGAAPFECVAARRFPLNDGTGGTFLPFAVSMIALLVGALTETFDREKWALEGVLPERSVPLDTGREAYGNLRLVQKLLQT